MVILGVRCFCVDVDIRSWFVYFWEYRKCLSRCWYDEKLNVIMFCMSSSLRGKLGEQNI